MITRDMKRVSFVYTSSELTDGSKVYDVVALDQDGNSLVLKYAESETAASDLVDALTALVGIR